MEEPTVPTELSKAITGPVEVTRRDDHQNRQWSVSAKSSNLDLAGEGKLRGTMQGVSGALFQKDAVASTFKASEAYADQAKNMLKLTKEVVITAEKQGLSLKADKVAWLPDSRYIEASGNVMLDGKDYSAGPFDRLLATPDLKKVGTPDTFGKQPAKTPQPK